MSSTSGLEARLRARGWHLLGALAAHGVTPELLPTVRALPMLAAHLADPFDADRAAALHYQVFGLALPGGCGLFLEAEHARLHALYARAGFSPPGAEMDALDALPALLAALCAAEAEGRATRPLQAEALGEHLLRLLPPLGEALARQRPFYAAYGALLAEFAADHAAALKLAPSPWRLPDPPDLLADPTTRLDDIARALLRPAGAGFLLDRARLRAAAQAAALPLSLGDRPAMLGALLRSAGEYNALPALLDALDACAQEALRFYAQLAADLPLLTSWVAPWQERSDATRALLAAIRASTGEEWMSRGAR